jgi:hypothetical protein
MTKTFTPCGGFVSWMTKMSESHDFYVISKRFLLTFRLNYVKILVLYHIEQVINAIGYLSSVSSSQNKRRLATCMQLS